MKLFGGHTVNTIVESQWVKIILNFPFTEQKEDPKERIQDVSIEFFFRSA